MVFLAVQTTSWLWLILELVLVARDHRRGKGSTAADRGTRRVVVVCTLFASLAATSLQAVLGPDSPWQLPTVGHIGWAPALGLATMWAGLMLRIWSIAELGSRFRTTVEVDPGQDVVARGPYRWVRHPSYSGVLLLAGGYGLAADNWLSVLVSAVLPLASVLLRIDVEEQAMVRVVGRPYELYRAHTKRLVPGVW